MVGFEFGQGVTFRPSTTLGHGCSQGNRSTTTAKKNVGGAPREIKPRNIDVGASKTRKINTTIKQVHHFLMELMVGSMAMTRCLDDVGLTDQQCRSRAQWRSSLVDGRMNEDK